MKSRGELNPHMRARSWVNRLLAVTLAAIIFASLAPVQAQTLVTLLDAGAGVRPLGLGGAFVALADDENALFYNPAGLGFLERMRFGSFYEPRFGASFGDLALAGKHFGLGLLFFNLGGLERRDANDKATGTFTYGSTGLIGAGGARLADLPLPAQLKPKLPENLALGLGLKLYQVSALEGGSGSGLALDLGLLWAQGLTIASLPVGLRLGAKVENLGLPVEYGTGYTEAWGIGLRLGTAATVRDLTVALDLETRGAIHLGAEYRFTRIGLERFGLGTLSLRAGGFIQGGLVLTLGFGLQFQNFYLDYAFITYPQAADTHRLAFAAEFKLPKLF